PPFPSISLVLSQFDQPSYLVFPWTSISYQNPIVPAPMNPVTVAPPQPSVAPTLSTLSIQFFANIVTRLRAQITS
ncbi:hypothetical protein K438DRAFT_1804030, partial [Mycena galopus ATCC 62051]